MERIVNFNTLNNSEINKHYKLIETSDKLLEKMKESGEKFLIKNINMILKRSIYYRQEQLLKEYG